MSNIIDFKTQQKKKSSKAKPVVGNFCFNWNDVEIVECGKSGNAILHFKSGRSMSVNRDFESARQDFNDKRSK